MNIPEETLAAVRESVGDLPELQGSIAALSELATLLWLAGSVLSHALRVVPRAVDPAEPMAQELALALAFITSHQLATATTADALQLIQHEREVGRRS